MSIEVAILLGVVVAASVALGAVIWGRRRDDGRPSGPSMELETLESKLETFEIETNSSRVPELEIATPYLHADDEIVGAARAKFGPKRALLLLLDNRMLGIHATVGDYGAEVRVVSLEAIESFDQSYDVGGEFHFTLDDETLTYTHVPRSQTSPFADAVRDTLSSSDGA